MKKLSLLLIVMMCFLNAKAQRGLAIHGGYSMPTSNINHEEGSFLFLKDAKTVGLDYSLGFKNKASGFKISADLILGQNSSTTQVSKDCMRPFCRDIPVNITKFSDPNPMGVSVMAGPNIALFTKSKKLPMMWLDLQVGAVFTKPQSLQFFDIKERQLGELKNTTTSFVYSPTLTVNLFKTKGLMFNGKVGYNSVGGLTFGIGISERDCTGAMCEKCNGPGCNWFGTPPKVIQD